MTTTYPASQKQFDFIKKLLSEKQVDAQTQELVDMCREHAVAGTLRSKTASNLIDVLLALPRKKDASDDIQAGVYAVNGDMIVRVYLGQQSGQMLAKQVHLTVGDATYDYIGMARKVFADATTWTRLSIEEVGALGISSGQCIICGRRLDDPESVDRGIGPVCASRY
jgi:hypothetical protein